MLVSYNLLGAYLTFDDPGERIEVEKAIDEYNRMLAAKTLGNRLSAEIVLRDHSSKILVPNQDEWQGLNWLEYDGILKHTYK